MIKSLPPALIFMLGAFLIPLLKGRIKSGYMLALPVIAYLNLLNLPVGSSWKTAFLDFPIILCRADKLSMVLRVFWLLGMYSF